MARANFYLVRPSLGQPLILHPDNLASFEMTFAYQKPYKWPEADVPYLSRVTILNELRQDPPVLLWKNIRLALTIHDVGTVERHPEYNDNYSEVKHAFTSKEQQYVSHFRWDVRVRVGLNDAQLAELRREIKIPTLIDLHFGSSTNPHALYVHEELRDSERFVVLQATDIHITQRNDKIPDLLSQVRSLEECRDLARRYINFNDNFRAFIKLANARWREEEGKVIVALTGDLVDYYFDGYWDGKFICGQGGQDAPDRRRVATGSSWGYSNVSKFREIVLGADGRGEALLCPLFTVLGNHDYLMNEVLLNWQLALAGHFPLKDFQYHGDFGLSPTEGIEYDCWAFPRRGGKHRTIAERKAFKDLYANPKDADPERNNLKFRANPYGANLDSDWSYWVAKPKSWQLSQYLRQISYDLDYELRLGHHTLLFLNTGEDRYPSKWDFGPLGMDKSDADRDYKADHPHCRGITDEHLKLTRRVLERSTENSLLLMFTHAPLLDLPDVTGQNITVLNEDSHRIAPPPPNAISRWLCNAFPSILKQSPNGTPYVAPMSPEDLKNLGFPLSGTRYFKEGARDPYLNASSADGKVVDLLHLISRRGGTQARVSVLVFSGHTHGEHEFRIEKVRETTSVDAKNFRYFFDNYADQAIGSDHALKTLSPLLLISGTTKVRRPKYREVIVDGASLASLAMRSVENITATAKYIPGCRRVVFRAHNGKNVSVREGVLVGNQTGSGVTVEIVRLDEGKIALMIDTGVMRRFVRAENGGGGRLKVDGIEIGDHEEFDLVQVDNKYALRTHNRSYVTADGGTLLANRANPQAWELFSLIEQEQLDTPVLLFPRKAQVFDTSTRRMAFEWRPVVGAVSYTIEIQRKQGTSWTSLECKSGITTTSYARDVSGAQQWRWRVWAVSAYGEESPKTNWREFRYLMGVRGQVTSSNQPLAQAEIRVFAAGGELVHIVNAE